MPAYIVAPEADQDLFEIWRYLAMHASLDLAERIEAELYWRLPLLFGAGPMYYKRDDWKSLGCCMGIIINISAELEEKISKRAAAKGLPVEEYAREVLERDAALPTLRELFGPIREEIQEKGTTDDELSAEIEGALSEVRARRRA